MPYIRMQDHTRMKPLDHVFGILVTSSSHTLDRTTSAGQPGAGHFRRGQGSWRSGWWPTVGSRQSRVP